MDEQRRKADVEAFTVAEVPIRIERRIEYLDVYRGVACLLVFFYHTAVNLSLFGVAFYGYHGVHLFFVLSGYLMTGKFLPALMGWKPLPNIGKFLTRRFLRIYPPYLVCLAVFVALRVASKTNVPDWKNVLIRVGLIFNYWDRYDYFSINTGFWSLAIEMQFYIILPLVVWSVLRLLNGGKKRAVWFAIVFLAVGIISRAFEAHFVDHTHPDAIARIRFKWATSHLDLFGVGILLRVIEGCVSRPRWQLGWRGAASGFILGLSLLGCAALWTSTAGNWQESDDLLFTALCPTLACAGFAVLLGTTGASPLRESRIFRWAGLVWVGQVSYSLYLYHLGVLYVFNRIAQPMRWGLSWEKMTLVNGLICLPFALCVAWLSYRFVEQPFYGVDARRRRAGFNAAPALASDEGV